MPRSMPTTPRELAARHARSPRAPGTGPRTAATAPWRARREFSWERTARLTHEVYEEARQALWRLSPTPAALSSPRKRPTRWPAAAPCAPPRCSHYLARSLRRRPDRLPPARRARSRGISFPPGLVRRVIVIDLPRQRPQPGRARAAQRRARGARASRRWSTASPASLAESQGALAGRRYEIGIIEHFWCAPYWNRSRRLRTHVLDLHNIESACCTQRCAAVGRRRRRVRAPRLSATPRSSWSATGCRDSRSCWPPPNAMPHCVRAIAPGARVAVYPERHSAGAAAAARRMRKSIVFSGNMEYHPNRSRGALLPPRGLAATARALARPGLAAGGKNPEAVRQFTSRRSAHRGHGQVDDAVARTGARPSGRGSVAGRQRYPAEDPGGLGRGIARGFHHLRRGRACRRAMARTLLAGRRCRAAFAERGFAAVGVLGRFASKLGRCRQTVAGKGVYMGNGVEEVGFLTQPGVIMVRYTGTVQCASPLMPTPSAATSPGMRFTFAVF